MRNSSNGGGSTSVKMPSAGCGGSSSASSKRKGSEVTGTNTEANSKNNSTAGDSASAAINGKVKAENLQADREAFLSAFEKPTQIYRYIRSRMIHSPIFLHRNLSYMKHRMSRTHKNRKTFKADDMLDKLKTMEMELKEKISAKINAKNFYNIILVGLFDPDHNWAPDTKAKVELQIARICLKKRKEIRTPIMKAFEGVCEIRVLKDCKNTNSPSKATVPPTKCPVISVPSDCFNLVNGHVVRSYVLMVKVSISKTALVKAGGSSFVFPPSTIAHKNNENGSSSSHTYSPIKLSSQTATAQVSKKSACVALHRFQRSQNYTGSKLEAADLNPKVVIKQEEDLLEPKVKRRRSAPAARDTEQFIYANVGGNVSDGADDNVVFMGQVTIYDKQLSITLGNADYDLVLSQSLKRRSSFSLSRLVKQEAAWEILDSVRFEESISNQAKVQMGQCGKAKLKVAIRTSPTLLGPLVDHPVSIFAPYSLNGGAGTGEENSGEPPLRVIYQFVYNNNSRQQTEARDDLRCPWCSLNCFTLHSLLKHLKLCHTRFRFHYVPVPSGARVDVSINESFDGSYTGSAYDLVAQPPGEAFARNGPTKRTKVFSLIVCHPERVKPSLQEFLENDEKDSEQRRSYITGHNRLYHHTTTCLPIHPKEIEVDSEGEQDPEWLQVKTSLMIDDFTDVNEGEKELMKMWNLHVLKHNYVGDCQIPLACEKFVEYQGKELIRKNLYRNFVLHLTNLFDFGLLSPQGMYLTIQKLQTQMKENNSASSLRDSWKAHMPSQVSEPNFILKAGRPTVSEAENALAAFRANLSTASSKKASATAVKTC